MAKSCNLIGYAGIPATENKWLVGRPSLARVAISRIEKAWLREASIYLFRGAWQRLRNALFEAARGWQNRRNLPYSRKLSRVKTFANSIKQSISRIKPSRFAEALSASTMSSEGEICGI